MANSTEYPDLKWVAPASFTRGRYAGAPRFIVIHTTEGSSHDQSAEDGAAYDARRTDYTSTHYFVDRNSVVHCVKTTDIAHTAGPSGNKWGIQYELCGRASYDRAWWLGDYGRPMLKLAARQAARDAKKYGIPVKKITPADLRAGGKGFVGHVDVTYAWSEVDHTDPGKNFPWPEFLAMVNEEMNPAPVAEEEDDMIAPESHPIPAGYAFAKDGETLTDKSKVLAVLLPPIGLKGHPFWAGKALYLSLGGDLSEGGQERVRVAVHNGAGWTISVVSVKDVDGRGSGGLKLPAAATDSAYKISVGRVAPESGESAGDGPLALMVEIL